MVERPRMAVRLADMPVPESQKLSKVDSWVELQLTLILRQATRQCVFLPHPIKALWLGWKQTSHRNVHSDFEQMERFRPRSSVLTRPSPELTLKLGCLNRHVLAAPTVINRRIVQFGIRWINKAEGFLNYDRFGDIWGICLYLFLWLNVKQLSTVTFRKWPDILPRS